ncbi:MAG: TrpB-like pyridoxal phosphate-dependent enzyme [Opitutales bacterium]|nr:TrpB-like pyridoxal phosphate-dependent enzyme [Opitutales bacterium]
MDPIKFLLPDEKLPEQWYNIAADLPVPLPPPLHPGTLKPLSPSDLAPLFADELIKQEMSTERWIPIPDEVRQILAQWRCTPLFRARRLEKALGTPARIYYKYEGVSPAGSHKPNTAVAQVYYNKMQGVRRITTETGAGQWGSSLAFACKVFGLECEVYMVRCSFEQKPYRRAFMELMGATCYASPSNRTAAGRALLEKDPEGRGSLGMAISEAVEIAAQNEDTKYCLGSVLNHVMLHQTVIGQEAMMQMELANDQPDIVIGCAGGGSNFAGISFPFIGEKLKGKRNVRVIGVEPAACPTLTKGLMAYDFGDTSHLTPLLRMHTLGSTFVPPGIHAGGLRYHGMGPLVSHLVHLGQIEAMSVHQLEAFRSGMTFAQAEGIVPAPESNHAIAAVLREAEVCKQSGESKAILFNLSGHGLLDMPSYQAYLAGKLQDYDYPSEEIAMALAGLPSVNG